MLKSKLSKHEDVLRKEIFFTNKQWPHFNLLFDDVKKLSESNKRLKILIIERSYLYGSISLLAPFFYNHEIISVDCTPKKLISRGKYNKNLTVNPNLIKSKSNYHFDYRNIKIEQKNFDLILIPNLIHHISDHQILMNKCKRLLKKKGKLYIFEPLLRELHQKPEDYLRFTPYGLKNLLQKSEFINFKVKEEGSIFTSILYCWDQAFKYLPEKKREQEKTKFFKTEFSRLLKFEKRYKKNLVRKNTSFPVSFSILCSKK